MAFNEPVLTKRIPLEASQRKLIDIGRYEETGGYSALRKSLDIAPDDIVKSIEEANLRGRGGAGAPASMKWKFMPKPEAKKSPSYLVINADESEPGTFKDRYLLDYDPHQLLEGIAITGRAIYADACYIYIRGEYHYTAKVLDRAIAEAYDKGIFGQNGILGSNHKMECYLVRGAGAYICGEETGLLESLEGKRGWPRNKPPFPAQFGAFGKPTTVNNVETIALVPHIVERGAAWFKSMGTPSSPGPKLYGISGHVNKPGVYEDELGITLDHAINKLAGGMKGGAFKASICGGISMGVLGPNQLDIKLDFDDVRFRGGCLGLGTAGMIVMNEHTDMVRMLRNCVRFYSHESCGQCTPCREGSAWMRKILDRIVDGQGRAKDLEMLLELEKTMGIMPGTTICGLADGTAWATRTFINKFYDEFAKVCPEEPVRRVSLKSDRGVHNVTTPMGSNTR